MDRFFDKIAVVTGAGSGIGASVVKELHAYGITVVGLDVDEMRLQNLSKDVGTNFFYKKCDVTKKTEIEEIFHWITNEIGLMAILVNCAGVLIRSTLLDVDDEDISQTLNVNIKGLLLCCKEAMKCMIQDNVDGHIININSINGHYIRKRPDISLTMVYAASKHGVTVLTEGLRQEVAKRNLKIKCTSISPGHVRTPLADEGRKEEAKPTQALEPKNVAEACIAALNTPPNVLVMTHSKVECSKATGVVSTQNQNRNDELDDSTITKNGSNSIQDHFSAKFASIIRETITNLVSPTNTQTITFLLTLLPTFPPAAILGSFVMVILSVLQSPSMLSLLQQTLSDVASLLQNPGNISIPDHLIDLDGIDMNGFYGMNDAVEYGTNLANEVFRTEDKDDGTLYSSGRAKLDGFAQPTKMTNRMKVFLNRKKQSRVDEDYDTGSEDEWGNSFAT